MSKRLLSFFMILIICFGFVFSLAGCRGSSVLLPENFSLNCEKIAFTVPRDTVALYDGPVNFSDITWGSTNEQVAQFKDGVVTAVGPGVAEVYADYFGIRHSCYVDCSALQYTADIIPKGALSTSEYDGYAVLAPPKSFDGPSEFFNDAAFIGDSISLKLSYYVENSDELGSPIFMVSGSYGVSHAVNDTMLLYFQGKEMSPQDALAAAKVNKVFVMLGMNDIALYGVDETIEYWKTFVENVKSKNPDITICIQSMTPVWISGEVGDLNNANVDEYNEKLKAFAAENGCAYFDIASFMKDADNGLATDYCSDSFVHLTDAGAYAWVKALKAYVGF